MEALGMVVLFVWDSDYPWDVRVEKICVSFVERGHEVHLLCRNRKQLQIYEYTNGLHIHRLPIMGDRIGGIISFPFFVNPLWLWNILSVAKQHKVELIVVRDLPLSLSGILIGWLQSIPCFIDMAEPYPEMLQGYWELQRVSFKQRLINYIVRNVKLAALVEQVACRLSAHIFPVSLEIKENLINKGIDAGKITLLHNTPTRAAMQFYQNTAIDKYVSHDRTSMSLLYVGDLTEARGLPLVIQAIAQLRENDEHVSLRIVGKGRFEGELRRQVEREGLCQEVIFEGWVAHEKLGAYFTACDIGIIPHIPTEHNQLTVPNKVFDYMAAGLPVVSSNLAPIRRILHETNSGVIFENYTTSSLVEVLMKLKDKETRMRLGCNGMQAVLETYSWENDFNNFFTMIEQKIAKLYG